MEPGNGWVEYWVGVALVVGTGFAAAWATIRGYFSKVPRNGGAERTGAVFFDSRVGYEIAEHLKRLADTIERIERQMKTTADAEEKAREIATAVAAARDKWERERIEGDKNG